MRKESSHVGYKGPVRARIQLRQEYWRIDPLEASLKYNTGWFAKGEDGHDFRIPAISESREQLREYRKSLVRQKEKLAAASIPAMRPDSNH